MNLLFAFECGWEYFGGGIVICDLFWSMRYLPIDSILNVEIAHTDNEIFYRLLGARSCRLYHVPAWAGFYHFS